MCKITVLALAMIPMTGAFADENFPAYVTVQNTDGMSVRLTRKTVNPGFRFR